MKPENHEELDRIASEICDKICHWPFVLKSQDKLDAKCAACQPLVDLANLIEKLEAEAPPAEGDTIYLVTQDCDNCPHMLSEAHKHCFSCRLFIVIDEPFTASEHLEDWYHEKIFKTQTQAIKKLADWTAQEQEAAT